MNKLKTLLLVTITASMMGCSKEDSPTPSNQSGLTDTVVIQHVNQDAIWLQGKYTYFLDGGFDDLTKNEAAFGSVAFYKDGACYIESRRTLKTQIFETTYTFDGRTLEIDLPDSVCMGSTWRVYTHNSDYTEMRISRANWKLNYNNMEFNLFE